MARLKLFMVAAPAAGLNKRHPPGMIEDGASPNAENVRVEAGVIFKRRGYTTLTSASVFVSSGDFLASGVDSGVTSGPILAQNFGRLSGTIHAMLATTGVLYYWNGAAWTVIKTGLNGALNGYHSATVMNDTWIYTNGVDPVQVWTGTGTATNLGGGSDYQTPNTHICRGVISFSDRLLLLGTNEDGAWYPYRVRWGELGKTGEFNEAQGGGYHDLLEDPTGIQGAALLGNYCGIYTGESIWMATYVGGNVVNAFTRVVTDTGCRAPRSVLNITNNEHVFMGNDDVYRFNGSSVIGVGEAIRDELFAGVSRANLIRCYGVLDRTKKLYHLFVPYGKSAGNISRAYIYDYEAGTWTIDSRPDITVAASLQIGKILYIDDLPSDPIDAMDHNAFIDDLGGQEDKELMVFCDSAGHVFQDDTLHIDDNDTAVDAYWDSKDFTLDPDYVFEYKRIEEILFEARGQSVIIKYSTDMGETWTTAGTQTLASENARYMLPIDVTARQIRLRFQNATSAERFWLRWIGLRFMVEANR